MSDLYPIEIALAFLFLSAAWAVLAIAYRFFMEGGLFAIAFTPFACAVAIFLALAANSIIS